MNVGYFCTVSGNVYSHRRMEKQNEADTKSKVELPGNTDTPILGGEAEDIKSANRQWLRCRLRLAAQRQIIDERKHGVYT